MDGTPDDSIDQIDQLNALLMVQEYQYRTLFNLSKQEMMDEPMDDVTVNLEIARLIAKKERGNQSLLEQKAKRGVR